MIVVVDYDVGNVGSIVNMLKAIDALAIVSSKPQDILEADKLILPGVGAFDHGMTNLRNLGLIQALNKKVLEDRAPILGICLGAQLMTLSSEEGNQPGLGWVKAHTIRFFSGQTMAGYRVPHMGWNEVCFKKESQLRRWVPSNPRFYFVHSYHFQCENDADILAETKYGYEFVSAFESENCFGVQFHPEKSHKYGMALLQSFVQLSSSQCIEKVGVIQ